MSATLFLFLLIAAWDLDNVMAAPKRVARCYPLTNGFMNWLTPSYGYGYGYGYPGYPIYPYGGLLYKKREAGFHETP